MKLLSLSFVVVAVLAAAFAAAFTTTEITAPTAFSYHPILDVNISGGINVTAFPFLMRNNDSDNINIIRHVINVTILNCTLGTSSSCTYGILAASLPLTINATNDTASGVNLWNYTAEFTQGRHKVRLNFTNVSQADDGTFGGALTAERIVQIDVEFNVLEIWGGVINLSSTGDVNISGRLHIGGGNLSVKSGGGTSFDCGPNDSGVWSCS